MICCYDRIKTIYHFIKPFLVKTSFFEEPLKLNFYPAVHDNPYFANSADPDQMASSEAIWSGSTLFVNQFVNLNKNIIWCNLIGW